MSPNYLSFEKVTYDSDADAMYLKLSDSEIKESQELNDFIIVDLDKDDKIMGIEIINASKNKDVLSKLLFQHINFKTGISSLQSIL